MSISFDGTTLVWDGEVHITNFTDSDTGVVTLTLTPAGGIGSLPALVDGTPGVPSPPRNVTVNEVAAGGSLPAPTVTIVDPGGPGTPAVWDLTFSVHAGATGATGASTNISSAPDVEGTLTDGYILVYSGTDSKWKISALKVGDTFAPSVITSYSGNSSSATLASITIPAQPFDWRPQVSGFAVATGTVNTHVDLQVRINSSTTGDQVGYGKGITGAGSTGIPAYPINLQRAFGSAITGSYGKVLSGSAATIYFNAIQTATTTDAWAVSNADCNFSVKVDPVP